ERGHLTRKAVWVHLAGLLPLPASGERRKPRPHAIALTLHGAAHFGRQFVRSLTAAQPAGRKAASITPVMRERREGYAYNLAARPSFMERKSTWNRLFPIF